MSEGARAKIIEEELYKRGFKPSKKLNIKLLMILSLAMSIAGVLIIYTLAQQASAPYAAIADIYGNYLMNYATVKIKGIVTGIPYFDNSTGRLNIRFEVDDGTGRMNVYAYHPVSLDLISAGKIPLPGDYVVAEVQLRVRETYTYGILQIADLLEINSTSLEPPIEVGVLTQDLAWKNVKAKGSVTSVRTVSTGILFEIDTGESDIDVLLPNLLSFYDKEKFYSVANQIAPGARVEVVGVVYLYKGSYPEILVRRIEDLKVLPPEKAVKALISELEEYEGKKVLLTASIKVLEYVSESREYTLKLEDSTGSVKAVASRDLLMNLNPFDLVANSVEATGSVKRIGGELVVQIEKLNTVKGWNGKTYEISEIDRGILGEIVAVQGEVESLSVRSTIVLFYLSDSTGKIKIFIPRSVYDRIEGVEITEGEILTLAGYVYEYRGELEIVIFSPLGVRGG